MQIILGTAQLGLNYGITNDKGKPLLDESLKVIKLALENNIIEFDSARAYGDSESILGIANKKYENMKIITKLDPLNEINELTSKDDIIKFVDLSISTSLKNLNIKNIDTFLLHRFYHYNNKIIWNHLLEKKKINVIKKLGVSIYYVDEGIQALLDHDIQHIQLPINILDHQWFCSEFLDLLKKRKDVTIHCRSILLQGILISSVDKWPQIENVNSSYYVDKLNNLVKEFKFNNKLELCLSYIKSIEWIDGLIMGVDNSEQLINNIELFKVRKLNNNEFNLVKETFKNVPKKLLNPLLW